MKTDNITKVKCKTVYTWRNKKTGEVFKEKKEGPDIVQDCTVTGRSERIRNNTESNATTE